jgi:thioredoxin reductase (NADPH)
LEKERLGLSTGVRLIERTGVRPASMRPNGDGMLCAGEALRAGPDIGAVEPALAGTRGGSGDRRRRTMGTARPRKCRRVPRIAACTEPALGLFRKTPYQGSMAAEFDLVIAGSGLAGLTAALTSARLGLKTLVLTGDTLGGQLASINRIDGYPGFPDGVAGYDLCPMTQEQAAAAGAAFTANAVLRVTSADGGWRVGSADGEDHRALAVIVATGARFKELGIPGEARLRGKGVSHCASCDAPLLRGCVVAVVGGGDSAAQEALTLAEAAARVVVLCRGPALKAQAAYRERLLAHPKVELRCNMLVEAIIGEASVTGIVARDRNSGVASRLDLSAVFVYVGLEPESAVIEGLLPFDAAGGIPTDGAMRTGLRGICAAGAVRSGWLGRAAISAAEGAMAAIAAYHFVGSGIWRNT